MVQTKLCVWTVTNMFKCPQVIFRFCFVLSIGGLLLWETYVYCGNNPSRIRKTYRDSSKLTINLLCVNKEVTQDSSFCSHNYFENLKNSVADWASKGGVDRIIVWYDKTDLSRKNIGKSKRLILSGVKNWKKVKFKSIDEIEFISNNRLIFSKYLPFYFRIDYLKMVICAHSLLQYKGWCIFADLEVEAMSKNELFSPQNLEDLAEQGVLTNYGLVMENQFIQMVYSEEIVNSLKLAINIDLMRSEFVLKDLEKVADINVEDCLRHLHLSPYWHVVDYLPIFFRFFTKKIKIKLNLYDKGRKDVEFNPREIESIKAFGNYLNFNGDALLFSFTNGTIFCQSSRDLLRFFDDDGPFDPLDIETTQWQFRCDIIVRLGKKHKDEMPEAISDEQLLDFEIHYWR